VALRRLCIFQHESVRGLAPTIPGGCEGGSGRAKGTATDPGLDVMFGVDSDGGCLRRGRHYILPVCHYCQLHHICTLEWL
jgi:hypothetical protein